MFISTLQMYLAQSWGADKGKYTKRIISEMIKWAASIVLCIGHTLTLKPSKGWKLIQFRWNVTKGLVGK